MRKQYYYATLAASLLCLCSHTALAQDARPQPSGRTSNAGRTAPPNSGQRQADGQQQIVQLISMKNQGEIELSQLGLQKAQSDQVKQFAQMMIDDHQKFLSKLQQAQQGGESIVRRSATGGQQAGSGGVVSNANGQQSRQPLQDAQQTLRQTADQIDDVAGRSSAGTMPSRTGRQLDMMAVLRDIHQKEQQLVKKELQQKQGAQFDKAFMGVQCSAHTHMLAALEAFGQQANGELQNVIEEGRQTTEQHLEKAKQIMSSLEKQGQQ